MLVVMNPMVQCVKNHLTIRIRCLVLRIRDFPDPSDGIGTFKTSGNRSGGVERILMVEQNPSLSK